MINTKFKLAFAVIVEGTDYEAEKLGKLLQNVSPHVDGLFVTITQPNKKVEAMAKLFGANISHFKWIDDFSAARNFNWSQVPKEYDYIMWGDADDIFRDMEKVRPTMEANPNVDVFILNYLYAFDEWNNPIAVHMKGMIVRNDGSAEWVARLHENFNINREFTQKIIVGVDRIHTKTIEDTKRSAERNYRIAKSDVDNNPNDPRHYWNWGNAALGIGKNDEAHEAFEKFLKDSQSDDEKYIVYLRQAEIFWQQGKKKEAIEKLRYAIGTKPNYPDAYNLMGALLFEMGKLEEAKESLLSGLVKKPPVRNIIVYNPRDYDYVPMMNLAKVFFAQQLPTLALPLLEGCLKIQPHDKNLKKTIGLMKKEVEKFMKVARLIKRLSHIKDDAKLLKEFDKVPADMVSHPAVCNLRNTRFIKKESSGKDLVYYCSYTEKEWDPTVAKEKGVGGSEEAVIHLAEKWADRGWNVTVYNACGYKDKQFGDITYKPFWSWNYRDKQDIVIVWRHPKTLDYDINAKKIYLDMHDVVEAGELTERRVAKLTKIFVKSQAHRDLYPHIPDEKFIIVPNGIDPTAFEDDTEKDQYLILNTSSPDRSLSAVIKGFKEIKKRVPKAKMVWAYGWRIFDYVHNSDAKIMEWKNKLQEEIANTKDFTALEMVSHGEIAKLYKQANVLFYPTEFFEIDCISVSKAYAAGAVPVMTDFAALGDKLDYAKWVHSDKTAITWSPPNTWDYALQDKGKLDKLVDYVVKTIKERPDNREEMRNWSKAKWNWNGIAKVWLEEFSRKT